MRCKNSKFKLGHYRISPVRKRDVLQPQSQNRRPPHILDTPVWMPDMSVTVTVANGVKLYPGTVLSSFQSTKPVLSSSRAWVVNIIDNKIRIGFIGEQDIPMAFSIGLSDVVSARVKANCELPNCVIEKLMIYDKCANGALTRSISDYWHVKPLPLGTFASFDFLLDKFFKLLTNLEEHPGKRNFYIRKKLEDGIYEAEPMTSFGGRIENRQGLLRTVGVTFSSTGKAALCAYYIGKTEVTMTDGFKKEVPVWEEHPSDDLWYSSLLERYFETRSGLLLAIRSTPIKREDIFDAFQRLVQFIDAGPQSGTVVTGMYDTDYPTRLDNCADICQWLMIKYIEQQP